MIVRVGRNQPDGPSFRPISDKPKLHYVPGIIQRRCTFYHCLLVYHGKLVNIAGILISDS